MIMTLQNSDRRKFPELFDQMFRSRAAVFFDRLNWKVDVKNGQEIDSYDRDGEPIYVMAVDSNGELMGSLRLMATTGPTMLRNEFSRFFEQPVDFSAPTIWECTKFCVPSSQTKKSYYGASLTSSELLIGLCELCLSSGVEFVVGVYDPSMTRVYGRIGWSPELLAQSSSALGNICVGIWEATSLVLTTMRQRSADRKNDRPLLAA